MIKSNMWNHNIHFLSPGVLKICLTIVSIMLWGYLSILKGQAMRMEIQIDEVFSIFVEDPVSFGTIQPNSGRMTLHIHDSGAGQVGITAKENTVLHVRVIAPPELVLDENNSLPFKLETAYLQDGRTNLQQATPLPDNTSSFQLSGSGLLADKMDPGLHMLRANVYFFGQVYAGDVSPGIYSGTIGVRVEYN